MSLEETIKNMVESQGLTLYDTELTSRNSETIFEVLITSKEGVSLDQCAEISHLLSPVLDVTPPVKGEYRLEVGTPGIERKLKTKDHFKLSIGETLKVTLITGEHYKGKLLSFEDETISVEDSEAGKIDFPFSEIQKAKTFFEW